MRSSNLQVSSMTTRQKVTIGVLIIVVLVVLWQIIGLFRGSSSTSPTTIKPTTPTMQQPAQMVPQPAKLVVAPQTPTPTELELMRLQQETQAKYLEALNELQMLRVEREIAETSQAIAAAKLATITSQKNIVNLLAPTPQVPPSAYGPGLINPAASSTTPPAMIAPQINYTVISVTQLEYRWSAVMGYQGSLYHVQVGDILPPDGSSVVSIDKSGVVLRKDNVRRKISLVPII